MPPEAAQDLEDAAAAGRSAARSREPGTLARILGGLASAVRHAGTGAGLLHTAMAGAVGGPVGAAAALLAHPFMSSTLNDPSFVRFVAGRRGGNSSRPARAICSARRPEPDNACRESAECGAVGSRCVPDMAAGGHACGEPVSPAGAAERRPVMSITTCVNRVAPTNRMADSGRAHFRLRACRPHCRISLACNRLARRFSFRIGGSSYSSSASTRQARSRAARIGVDDDVRPTVRLLVQIHLPFFGGGVRAANSPASLV